MWYFVNEGSEVSKTAEVKDSAKLKVNDKNPDKSFVEALTGQDGPLAAGAMPKMGKVSDTGSKNLAEAIASEAAGKKQKGKKPRKEKEDNLEEVEPKTPKEHATASQTDILKQATEARKYAIALENLQYSGELVEGLMKFSKKMEGIYKKVTQLNSEGCEDQTRFQKILDVTTVQNAWWKQAEARFVISSLKKTM